MDQQTYVIGAGMDVHNELGCGSTSVFIGTRFGIELAARHVPFRSEVRFPIIYKGRVMPIHYRVDFVCFDDVVVELKRSRLLDQSSSRK
jgi:GxxExxY protein